MTISRYSFALSLCFIGACSPDTDNRQTDKKQASPEVYQALVFVDGKDQSLRSFVREFRENSNAFDLKYQNSKFRVVGRISEIAPFHDLQNSKVGYPISISPYSDKTREDEFYEDQVSQIEGANIDGLLIFVMDFSKKEAAQLKRGQTIRTNCGKIVVQSDHLTFNNCVLEKSIAKL